MRWDVADQTLTTCLSYLSIKHCWEISMLFWICWVKKPAWYSFSQEPRISHVNNNNSQLMHSSVQFLKDFLSTLYNNALKLTLLLLAFSCYDDEHWSPCDSVVCPRPPSHHRHFSLLALCLLCFTFLPLVAILHVNVDVLPSRHFHSDAPLCQT